MKKDTHSVNETTENTMQIDSNVYEYSFYQTEEKNVYRALLEAIDHFAQQNIGLPDIVMMNFERRFGEVGADYWHTVYHGPVAIALRSPQDIEIEEMKSTPLLPNTFICIRHIERIADEGVSSNDSIGVTSNATT